MMSTTCRPRLSIFISAKSPPHHCRAAEPVAQGIAGTKLASRHRLFQPVRHSSTIPHSAQSSRERRGVKNKESHRAAPPVREFVLCCGDLSLQRTNVFIINKACVFTCLFVSYTHFLFKIQRSIVQ